MTDDKAGRAIMVLLATRARGATVCPSEVARMLAAASGADAASDNWRRAMPAVHAAVDRLLAEGAVELSWRGRRLGMRAGPYRIGSPKQDLD